MRHLLTACVPVLVLALAGARELDAQEPTPVPTLDNKGEQLAWSIDASGITWEAEPGAAKYALEFKVTAWRVNSTDPCLPPSTSGVVGVEGVEGLLPASDGTFWAFEPDLGDASPDRWLIKDATVMIRALNGAGEVLASGGGGHVADVFCAAPPLLPATGSGVSSFASGWTTLLQFAGATLAVLGVFALRRARAG